MLTKEYKLTEEPDNRILEKLYNTQFYISKEDKPYEKAIKASDDMEINVPPKNPEEFNFDIETTKMTHIKPDDIIGRLNSYSRENIKVKDFDININYFNRIKEDTSFQHNILGLPTLKNFNPKGNASEWVENISGNPPSDTGAIDATSNLNPVTSSKPKQASSSNDEFVDAAYIEFNEQLEKLEEEKKSKLTDPSITDKQKKQLLKGYNKKEKSIEDNLLRVTPIKPPSSLRKGAQFDENIPSARKSNSKKIGEGYVKEEAKIIDELVTPKKVAKEEKNEIHTRRTVKNVLNKMINKVEEKEKKMEFDAAEESESKSESEPKGKKGSINLTPDKVDDLRNLIKGGRYSYEDINKIRKYINDDPHIVKTMTVTEMNHYIANNYNLNFDIIKKTKSIKNKV